jgi:type II secretory pathway component PulC
MTLPVPASTAPLADTFKHINDLRAAALSAIDAFGYFTAQPSIAADANGAWSYTVTGLTTVQGVIVQNRGSRTTYVVVRSISGKVVTGHIYMPQVGSNAWATSPWGPGNFNAQVFAWGVK